MSSSDAGAPAELWTRAAPALGAGAFVTFFRDVHGHDPFPWQQRLTSEVLEQGSWPKVIDLPTGTGKTAVLDTAVFAMAVRPDLTPRRVVFVIDRRIVVDQVYERAQRLQSRINAGDTPVLRQVRDSLRTLSDGEPLGVTALRGGIPVDDGWAHRPDQPWVMVSTVDQFGSRLLFRGYGVGPGMWPVHAGLAGNDCLVILDEVHLSVPFAQTLNEVADLQPGPLPRRFVVVEMSATPSNRQAEPFTLYPRADLENCQELRRRVTAAKEATLKSVTKEDAIPAAVLKLVKQIDKNSSEPHRTIRSVGVIVNRVRTAREIHRALMLAGLSAHLITGRMRPLDRVVALTRIGPLVDPDGHEQGDSLAIVVATQAIEVGADFSFEVLITECAPADCLRQRFGRLDRRGTYSERTGRPAQAWILGVTSVVGTRKPDPIYGGAVKATWKELQRRAKQGRLDVGSQALKDFPDAANAPRPSAPLLLSTHLDAWAQTSPQPVVQPSIEWFLHGMNQNRTADVSIVWRRDRSTEVLRLVPPRQTEALQVPIGAVTSWLSGAAEVEIADVAQEDESRGPAAPTDAHRGNWVRWEGSAEGAKEIELREIHPGDLLVVDPTLGGLSWGTWDQSSSDSVSDLGDQAQLEYRQRVTLRLDPRLPYVNSPPTPSEETSAARPTSDRINEWLERWASEAAQPDWIGEVGERLGEVFGIRPVRLSDESPEAAYYILIERHRDTKKPVIDVDTMDGGDEVSSLSGTGTVLRAHLDGVGGRAEKIARRLGLPAPIQEDLRLAGSLHDLGKVDRRFQLQLVGGDRIAQELLEEPLAKSLAGAANVRTYPSGMRHELASIVMIESNPSVLNGAHDGDLVLHLIGSHHGWARPLPPILEDPEPQTLSFSLDGHSMAAGSDLVNSSVALSVADRFWRLLARYGYHGLAWLEAILRLADHQQSAAESEP